MAGPISDSYDPEFGTSTNAEMVSEAVGTVLQKIEPHLPTAKAPILTVVNPVFPSGKTVSLEFTERELRILRFAINRALESL
jgi:hypothetical protein